MYSLILTFNSPVFWFMVLLTVGLTLLVQYLSKNFNILEVFIQLAICLIVYTISLNITISNLTGLKDTEILSGYITSAEYQEPWTERVRHVYYTYSKVGKTTISTPHYYYTNDYRGPKWYKESSFGDTVGISQLEYDMYVKSFNNCKVTSTSHINQVSVGDGKTWSTYFNDLNVSKIPNNIFPYYRYHNYENLIKASNSLLKVKKQLKNYPTQTYPIAERNVLSDTKIVSAAAISRYNDLLSKFNAKYGSIKEMRAVIYFTDKPQDFIYSVKAAWTMGKKNDIDMIIGLDSSGNVVWSEVITYTKKEIFKTKLKSFILYDFKLKDVDSNINTITDIIIDKYKRTSMEEYKYLINDINVPIKVHIITFIIWLVLFCCVSVYMWFADVGR